MQIAASTLKLAGQTLSYRSQETHQHVEMWIGDRPQPRPDGQARPVRGSVETASADGGLFDRLQRAAKGAAPPAAGGDTGLDAETERILMILEKLFGMKGARRMVMQLRAMQADLGQAQAQASQAPGQQRAGWGMIAETSQRTVSYQSASLSAEGSLTLADGSSLSFTLDWSQTAMRVQESSSRVALGDAKLKDPLVIDLDGNGIAFSGTMPLALGGGAASTVARPAGSDAILVRDANGNGRVDEGEVVGAASGQAFAELGAMDSDGNHWIDEGDAVWTQLRLLDGSGQLRALDGTVGAIATASVGLPFEHRDDAGGLQAVGRRGGVVIAADGSARAAAQVDLVA